MSNFVSCDRNIENLNLLADLILARGLGSSLLPFGPFRFEKGRFEKFPFSSALMPASYSRPQSRPCYSCGAVNGITELIQVKNNARGRGAVAF